MAQRRTYLPYEDSRQAPNIVVDGSPNESTVLTLSHWPGIDRPPGIAADTSAEMAFLYLDEPTDHPPAEVVTNNHFDQDGAVGLFALIHPAEAAEHRSSLIALAEAGDFAVFTDRSAARASMIAHAFADPRRSPIADQLSGDPDTDTTALLEGVLPRLLEFLHEPDRYRDLWTEEDDALSGSEEVLRDGRALVSELPALDLAVIDIDESVLDLVGHRFGFAHQGPLHPMAVHNATQRSRLLFARGNHYRYVDRYETWVEFHSRRVLPRVDMRPLATTLNGAEAGATTWTAGSPAALSPELAATGASTLGRDDVVAAIVAHLTTRA